MTSRQSQSYVESSTGSSLRHVPSHRSFLAPTSGRVSLEPSSYQEEPCHVRHVVVDREVRYHLFKSTKICSDLGNWLQSRFYNDGPDTLLGTDQWHAYLNNVRIASSSSGLVLTAPAEGLQRSLYSHPRFTRYSDIRFISSQQVWGLC